MRISKKGAIWVADSTYDERELLNRRGAGWWFHGGHCSPGNCVACAEGLPLLVYYTPYIERAAVLATYADNSCRAELENYLQSKEEPCNPNG